ncbi:MAG: DNA-protecting protein DprA [Clostridiales bacterium]|nr:DNA-protecting protein DprA [Clostridiales bacterium]
MNRCGFKVEKIDDESVEYPYRLKQIKNPPKRLFCIGDLSLLEENSISVVGARKASSYGVWVADTIGKQLAENGVVTVSGLAAGIDTAAHKGALRIDGGKTIAVLGCGIDICFPTSNNKLRDEIAKRGLLLSEYEPGVHATRYTFPMRNRIISGLSLATVVAEAGNNSGSLITAERAVEQGREVLAVPGNINSINSFGCNKLIAEGATPLIFVDDIFNLLNLKKIERSLKNTTERLSGVERNIFELIAKEGEASADFIALKLGLSIVETNGYLSVLEIKGLVGSELGKVFVV